MTPDWIGAFVVGLIGAGHCMGMCGGIASLLSIGNTKPSPVVPLLYNLGRLLSYAVIGGVIGGCAAQVLSGRVLVSLTVSVLVGVIG